MNCYQLFNIYSVSCTWRLFAISINILLTADEQLVLTPFTSQRGLSATMGGGGDVAAPELQASEEVVEMTTQSQEVVEEAAPESSQGPVADFDKESDTVNFYHCLICTPINNQSVAARNFELCSFGLEECISQSVKILLYILLSLLL